ncbi:hypothetical protein, partial [Neisseria sicca]|uniref:hypothetical protein n=1 Tax=Neisseria sicca TaxID=490 RepID=UPI001C9982A0
LRDGKGENALVVLGELAGLGKVAEGVEIDVGAGGEGEEGLVLDGVGGGIGFEGGKGEGGGGLGVLFLGGVEEEEFGGGEEDEEEGWDEEFGVFVDLRGGGCGCG